MKMMKTFEEIINVPILTLEQEKEIRNLVKSCYDDRFYLEIGRPLKIVENNNVKMSESGTFSSDDFEILMDNIDKLNKIVIGIDYESARKYLLRILKLNRIIDDEEI